MSDPLDPLWGKLQRPPLTPIRRGETEQIEIMDRVSYAETLIREHELPVWYERDWWTAVQIARRCPMCAVFSVPLGARWFSHLDEPPPWGQKKRGVGEV
jgi:hypothetical protein